MKSDILNFRKRIQNISKLIFFRTKQFYFRNSTDHKVREAQQIFLDTPYQIFIFFYFSILSCKGKVVPVLLSTKP